jgi:hypothetical protein
MTSLICWVGVDSRGPTSVYLASDSRISWLKSENWDTGRKVFASQAQPDIFAFCGDVLFASQKIGQIVDQLDRGFLYDVSAEPMQKHAAIFTSVRQSFEDVPNGRRDKFSIIHCTRNEENMRATFSICKISWSNDAGWLKDCLPLPNHSDLVDVLGTGTIMVRRWYERWKRSDVAGTSRSIFSAFCDALNSREDGWTGGAPQLAGVHRSGIAKLFGIVWNGQPFFLGEKVRDPSLAADIDWYNELLERCDRSTLERLIDAQKHARPLQVKP